MTSDSGRRASEPADGPANGLEGEMAGGSAHGLVGELARGLEGVPARGLADAPVSAPAGVPANGFEGELARGRVAAASELGAVEIGRVAVASELGAATEAERVAVEAGRPGLPDLGRMRPAWAEIDLDALAHNVGEARRLVGPGVLICAAVKADAYGHGAAVSARELLASGADRLSVATLDEGIELRRSGIAAPILIMGAMERRRA
ncbi:MAG: alanine racemase, partial [Clostridiales bacterium]|nr:alanine racemase [Clostridiales bacterium]